MTGEPLRQSIVAGTAAFVFSLLECFFALPLSLALSLFFAFSPSRSFSFHFSFLRAIFIVHFCFLATADGRAAIARSLARCVRGLGFFCGVGFLVSPVPLFSSARETVGMAPFPQSEATLKTARVATPRNCVLSSNAE